MAHIKLHFNKAKNKDSGKNEYQCKYCPHVLAGSASTTRLRAHLIGATNAGSKICPNVPDEVKNSLSREINKRQKTTPGYILSPSSNLPPVETEGVTEAVMQSNETSSNPHQIESGANNHSIQSFSPEVNNDFGNIGQHNWLGYDHEMDEMFANFDEMLLPYITPTPPNESGSVEHLLPPNVANFQAGETSEGMVGLTTQPLEIGSTHPPDLLTTIDLMPPNESATRATMPPNESCSNRQPEALSTSDSVAPLLERGWLQITQDLENRLLMDDSQDTREANQEGEGSAFQTKRLVGEAFVARYTQGAMKPYGPTVGLEEKLAEVLRYLEKENVGIVGVYGQGGVGKTTLLKKINNYFVGHDSERFLVVWIDVPKDTNLEAIQQAVGEKLGLPDKLKDSSMEKKAAYISEKLQRKKIILLLDDIRKAINLSKIGIPPSYSLNESKVVFTTRPEHACKQMEPQPGWSTSIETLGDEEAWQLFVMRVGEDIINSHPQIQQIARRVAKKCGGLPLALSIIGKAMSCNREPKVWEHTVKTFERPSLQHSEAHQEADGVSMSELFSILRYSYDNLPNETYKSCFLYCALYPEAYIVGKEGIIEYWMFEDFWIDCDGDDFDPRCEAYRILNFLTSSCLLEDEKDWVRMHDVVRSMALWIRKEDTLVMAGMELEETSSVRMWKHMKRVSLMVSDIKELKQVPACPNLLTLLLCINEQLNEICTEFFESMGMLTVLDLAHTSIQELPESISRLVSLTYLNISYTMITELPVALIKLKKLRYLNVGLLENLRLSRKNQVIHQLSSLQFLGMRYTRYYYYEEDEISKVGGDDEILLEELRVLENLKVLEITLRSFSGLMTLFDNHKLFKTIKSLALDNFKTPNQSLNISLLAQSKHLEKLLIKDSDLKELKNSQESIDSSSSKLLKSTSTASTQMISFNSITMLGLGGCSYLEDITCVVSMPNLRKLYVFDCDELREIICKEKIGEVPLVGKGEEVYPVFSSLAILKLDNLPILKSIYPSNTLALRFLYYLSVKDCPQLKKLPLDPNRSVLGCSQIELFAEEDWWDAVEWEDDDAKAALLPRFDLYNLS